MSYKTLLFSLFFIFSCRFHGEAVPIVFDDFIETTVEKSLGIEKTRKTKKIRCEQEGEICSEHERCKDFCNDLFFYHKGKEACYGWSYSYFKGFEKLAYQLKTLSFSNLNFPTVKCFFEMSEDHRIRFFENFTKKSAEKFLAQIATNPKLALSLFQADKKHFDILKDLFEKIDRRVQRAIGKEIFSQSHFLTLAHKHKNRSAWGWIDSFIHYDCKKSLTCQNPLEYYCEILEGTSRGELESLFENNWFENAFKNDIESSTCDSYYCEYGKVSDFKEFCEKF